MKPPAFTYHDPSALDEAVALLATYGGDAKLLAGGQSLIPLLNMRLAEPAHIVDINRLPEMAYILEVDGGLAIGGLTRHRDVERSALVHRHCPLLAEAVILVGHAAIRSRGTIGGTLAHADPAAELPGVLLALGGRVRAVSRRGSRTVAAADLFVDQMLTSLRDEEVLVEAWFPVVPEHSGAAFVEVSRRHGDYALAGVGAQVVFDRTGTIAAAHLALIGVGGTPVRASAAEALLVGERPGEALFRAAAARATGGLEPAADMHGSADYRRSVASVLVERALQAAAGRALRGEQS